MEAINQTEPTADEAQPAEGEQRIDIAELLIAMKNAIGKMSVKNSHRGVMTTAGSVIIHLITENRKLAEICEQYHQGIAKSAPAIEQPLVSLV